MILKEILLEFLPMSEIKSRIKNKQIKFNNTSITDLNEDLDLQEGYWALGDFIYYNINSFKELPNFILIRDFFGKEKTNIKKLEFLTGYSLLSLSKKEEFVFINK